MPRRIAAVTLLFAALTATLGAERPRDFVDRRFTGRVVGVVDGDTIDLLLPSKAVLRMRLHGIDTPERGEPFNTQARNFTRVLLFSREVSAFGTDVDRYGRIVARVTVDGKDASVAILAAGLGCTFHRYAAEPTLDAAQSYAQRSRAGFWAPGAQRPKCVARERRRPPRI